MDFVHFIGIDVSKNWFDVALAASLQKTKRFANTADGIASFRTAFAEQLKQGFVVLEATGGYETALITTLVMAEVALHRAAPWQAHSFARSLGQTAKTDALDAKALARFAAERHASLRRFELPSQDQQTINELMMRGPISSAPRWPKKPGPLTPLHRCNASRSTLHRREPCLPR